MAYRKNQSTAKVGPNSKKSSLLFHQSITVVALAALVSGAHDYGGTGKIRAAWAPAADGFLRIYNRHHQMRRFGSHLFDGASEVQSGQRAHPWMVRRLVRLTVLHCE